MTIYFWANLPEANNDGHDSLFEKGLLLNCILRLFIKASHSNESQVYLRVKIVHQPRVKNEAKGNSEIKWTIHGLAIWCCILRNVLFSFPLSLLITFVISKLCLSIFWRWWTESREDIVFHRHWYVTFWLFSQLSFVVILGLWLCLARGFVHLCWLKFPSIKPKFVGKFSWCNFSTASWSQHCFLWLCCVYKAVVKCFVLSVYFFFHSFVRPSVRLPVRSFVYRFIVL